METADRPTPAALVPWDVIERARERETAAFNQIVTAYQGKVLGTVYKMLGAVNDVEDVAQDVFVRLYRALPQLRETKVFEPWLQRLTVNTVYDHLRSRKRRRDSLLDDLREEQVHCLSAEAAGRAYEIEEGRWHARELASRILQELRPADRVLLVLKEVEGLSLRELEGVFEANTGALKVRLFRARKRALKAYRRLEESREAPAAVQATPQLALAS